jgi:Arc/MetJ family transcription regulator
MTRLSITVDPEIIEEVRRLAKVRTKREAIERALQEFVRHHRLQELQALAQTCRPKMS